MGTLARGKPITFCEQHATPAPRCRYFGPKLGKYTDLHAAGATSASRAHRVNTRVTNRATTSWLFRAFGEPEWAYSPCGKEIWLLAPAYPRRTPSSHVSRRSTLWDQVVAWAGQPSTAAPRPKFPSL